jgi:hypothetical protein
METSSIEIKRIVRRMRGGSQAHMVEAEDGGFYVAKFANNPQGSRTLINEWVVHRLFQRIGLTTPSLCILRLPQGLKENGDLRFDLSGCNRSREIEGDLHLGSPCPVNPEQVAMFDFVPRRLLPHVTNLSDFARAFVLDKWLGQVDARQVVFARDRAKPNRLLRAHFIDHGMSFSGKDWEFKDALRYGLYHDSAVYSLVNMHGICEDAISRIEQLADLGLFTVIEEIPDAWFADQDYTALSKLLEQVEHRRTTLRSLISRHLEALLTRITLVDQHTLYRSPSLSTSLEPSVPRLAPGSSAKLDASDGEVLLREIHKS